MIDNIRWDLGYNPNINKVELENNILDLFKIVVIPNILNFNRVSSRYSEIIEIDYILN